MSVSKDHQTKETLLQFLSKESPSFEVRVSASEYLLGLTGGQEGRGFIVDLGPSLISVAVDLLSCQCHSLSDNAVKSVVNLSSDESSLQFLMEDVLLSKLFDLVSTHECTDDHSVGLSENCILALSNMAHWPRGAQAILSFLQKNPQLFHKAIECFFTDTNHLHHFGSFLANLSQVKEARLLLLEEERTTFQRLLSFISFGESVVRQKGVVAAIKNCCFEVDSHKWLLSDKVDILPRLLLPLAGNDEFDEEDNEKLPLDLQYLADDKEREPEAGIRKMLVEAIFQLCATEECRKYIKDHNTYVIMRQLHIWETDEACNEAVENLVSLLIADEPEEEFKDLNKIEIPVDIQKRFNKS